MVASMLIGARGADAQTAHTGTIAAASFSMSHYENPLSSVLGWVDYLGEVSLHFVAHCVSMADASLPPGASHCKDLPRTDRSL
jgi:hypothetical protein